MDNKFIIKIITFVALYTAIGFAFGYHCGSERTLDVQKQTIKMFQQNNLVGNFDQQPLNELGK